MPSAAFALEIHASDLLTLRLSAEPCTSLDIQEGMDWAHLMWCSWDLDVLWKIKECLKGAKLRARNSKESDSAI